MVGATQFDGFPAALATAATRESTMSRVTRQRDVEDDGAVRCRLSLQQLGRAFSTRAIKFRAISNCLR